jgi:hypothetical protein
MNSLGDIKIDLGSGININRSGQSIPPGAPISGLTPAKRWRQVQFERNEDEDVREAINALRDYPAMSRDETSEDVLDRTHLRMQNNPTSDHGTRGRMDTDTKEYRVQEGIVSAPLQVVIVDLLTSLAYKPTIPQYEGPSAVGWR